MERQGYTDLTDEQWAVIEPLFVGMREYKHSKRELTNAVLYLVDSGCKGSSRMIFHRILLCIAFIAARVCPVFGIQS